MSQNFIEQSVGNSENSWGEAFRGLPDLSEFDEFKKIEIAADMAALLVHSGLTRAEIARALGWSRSRVTNVLSGEANFTLKTVYEFSRALGYDFDLLFRKPDVPPAYQPWIVEQDVNSIVLHLQTASEVLSDFNSGTHREMYISFGSNLGGGLRHMGSVDEIQSIRNESTSFSLTGPESTFSLVLNEQNYEHESS